MDVLSGSFQDDIEFRSNGFSAFSVEELDSRKSGGFCYEDMAGSPDSYMLSAILWAVIQSAPDAYASARIRRLYTIACNPVDTSLTTLLFKSMATPASSEIREHVLRSRIEVFRRCMELLLFPKAIINPWLTGKHREDKRYGQHVQGCGIYAPNAAFQSNTLVSVFRKSKTADERLELMSRTSGAAIPQRPLSASTLYRCLQSLEEAGWIKITEIWTRSNGRLRFISPQIFCVINKLEKEI
jgi:hypothetical protein